MFWLFSPFIPPYNTQQSQNTGYIPATLCHNVTVSPPLFDIQRYISDTVLCLCDVWGKLELRNLQRASRESRFRLEIVVRIKVCDNHELITEKGGLQFLLVCICRVSFSTSQHSILYVGPLKSDQTNTLVIVPSVPAQSYSMYIKMECHMTPVEDVGSPQCVYCHIIPGHVAAVWCYRAAVNTALKSETFFHANRPG